MHNAANKADPCDHHATSANAHSPGAANRRNNGCHPARTRKTTRTCNAIREGASASAPSAVKRKHQVHFEPPWSPANGHQTKHAGQCWNLPGPGPGQTPARHPPERRQRAAVSEQEQHNARQLHDEETYDGKTAEATDVSAQDTKPTCKSTRKPTSVQLRSSAQRRKRKPVPASIAR